ncbi:redox-regulated ATPase YchF [Candidatus Woesearchaeota archaeon]|nr:redox-regulated ATPase YchF [Candidatus Woesearchaeota archaeon]
MLVGLVGKANVGKSSFFKAATLAEVEISNRPFVTIKPNRGEGYVKIECVDKEFNTQCNPRFGFCIDHSRFVPIELLDVAGLVPGASEGRGLGNEFLNDLNEADALIHIVDVSGSTDENGNPVEKLSHDPEKDIKFLENELDQWYLRILKKSWEKFSRTVAQANLDVKKSLAKQLSGLRVDEEVAQDSIKNLNLSHNPATWSNEELLKLARELRRRSKPIIIAANKIDVEGARFNFERLKDKYEMIACSAEVELALREAAKHELISYVSGEDNFHIVKSNENKLSLDKKTALNFIEEFLEENKTTGVQDVLNKIVFEKLKYIAVFPGGVNNLKDPQGRVIPDCFLLKEGSTALDFAYKLHKDLGDNFVKAINVRDKKPVGKEYKLKNRDVIEIVARK